MTEKQTVSALITGGQVNAGPPLGPALGPFGLNVMAVVNEINKKTEDYNGMRVPVKIIVDTDVKSFEIEVGLPTSSALIVKESGVEKGSGTSGTDYVGNLSMEQIVKIAKSKIEQSYGKDIRSVSREVIGSCVSMGIKVEDLPPKDIFKLMDEGKWSDLFTNE